MIAFQVKDMTCGHCASTITQSVKAKDPNAKVTIDIGQQLVRIESAAVTGDDLRVAIVDAGYSPALVDEMADDRPAKRGSCCGCCH